MQHLPQTMPFLPVNIYTCFTLATISEFIHAFMQEYICILYVINTFVNGR